MRTQRKQELQVINEIKVVVIGDVTKDIFMFKIKGNTNSPIPLPRIGGACYVAQMIEKGMSPVIVPTPKIITYNESKNNDGLVGASWPVRSFRQIPAESAGLEADTDPRVYRCLDTPRPAIPFTNVETDKFPTPSKDLEKLIKIASATKGSQSPNTNEVIFLVIEDLAIKFDKTTGKIPKASIRSEERKAEWDLANFVISQNANNSHRASCPSIVGMINREIPFHSQLWTKLVDECGQHMVLIIYADTLRWHGLAISKQISWERTAQDFLAQYYTNDQLLPLRKVQHSIIRFGVTGAIHNYKIDGKEMHRLYFDPDATKYGIYRDAPVDGDVPGSNSIYVTDILRQLAFMFTGNNLQTISDLTVARRIGAAICSSIRRTQEHFKNGFGPAVPRIDRSEMAPNDKEMTIAAGLSFEDRIAAFPPGANLGDMHVEPIADIRIPVGNPTWSIINHSAKYDLGKIAMDIVMEGHTEALNQRMSAPGTPFTSRIWAPVVQFGGEEDPLVVVDRREIESYRSVHNLIRVAIDSKNRSRPLCIAVFGPPGSGKSFVVKVLGRSAGINVEGQMVEINLGELSRPEKLIQRIRTGLRKLRPSPGRVPLFFFDEFDASWRGEELGWLKQFLPLMETWPWKNIVSTVRNRTAVRRIGEFLAPILIFAGGTSSTYLDFSKERTVLGSEPQLRFVHAKGPDFVSRLSGHIDILGPNRLDESDDGYVIRRALGLRSLMIRSLPKEMRAGKDGRPLDLRDRFRPAIVAAMLKVTAFKHGMRSMRAILDMCVKYGAEGGIKYLPASIPTLPQLNMHVDPSEFMFHLLQAENSSNVR